MDRESRDPRFTGDKASVALLVVLTAVVAYLAWVGVSGHPLPRWILWVATVL